MKKRIWNTSWSHYFVSGSDLAFLNLEESSQISNKKTTLANHFECESKGKTNEKTDAN